ncbi:MAG: TfoX/Sxy family protein [Gaiellaceae bacterium]
MGSSPTFGIAAESPARLRQAMMTFGGSASESASGRDGQSPPRRRRLTIHSMYDETLAQRIRELVSSERSLTEKKMFGGLAFLLNGNMAVAASGQGGLLVRVDPDESERLLRENGASLMEMRGRTMLGWMRVEADAVRTKKQLSKWVDRGVSFARSLPAKP